MVVAYVQGHVQILDAMDKEPRSETAILDAKLLDECESIASSVLRARCCPMPTRSNT